eukprot:GILJ01001635.1.p1 GENE.GILJ01001635.1~~GILJ01001635.1.p1  ORF type:complete len:546 (+),score=116.59 GILJ01001635.1:1464-3101(+)
MQPVSAVSEAVHLHAEEPAAPSHSDIVVHPSDQVDTKQPVSQEAVHIPSQPTEPSESREAEANQDRFDLEQLQIQWVNERARREQEIEEERRTYRIEIESLMADNQELKQQVIDLTDNEKKLSEEIVKLDTLLRDLSKKLEKTTKAQRRAEEMSQQKEIEVTAKIAELDALKIQMEEELKEALQSKDAYSSNQRKALEDARASLSARDEELKSLQSQFTTLVEEYERTQEQLKSSEEMQVKAVRAVQEELANLDRYLSEERTAHEMTKRNAQERERVLEQNQTEISRALATVQRQLDERTTALHRAELERETLESERHQLEQQLKSFEQNVDSDKSTALRFKTELKAVLEENSRIKHELEAERSTFNERLAEAQYQLRQTEEQLRGMSSRSVVEEELQGRVRALTEHMNQKQRQIETLMSERAALQVEIENQRRLAEGRQHGNRPNGANVWSLDVEKGAREHGNARMRSIATARVFRQLPAEASKAVTMLDDFSLSTGAFLGQNPLVRLFVMFYVLLLQIWVFYLLMHATPELKAPDNPNRPPGM